ncbi:MAG TPA: hypothetical protein VL096_12100, partial [Pirellulaceae bacterium]|nr:hypothetical protein [Pirellulaceae bacterium]
LDESFFVLGFAQIDIATNGNEVRISENQSASRSLGYLTDQNLMYFDLSVGGWLYRNPYAERLTSIALMGEVHYTTTITNTDSMNVSSQGTVLQISNPYNRQDIVNSTIALQFEIANTTTLRVAAAFPLGDREDQRFFDSELQVQINRQF